jgi:hypothetical protein
MYMHVEMDMHIEEIDDKRLLKNPSNDREYVELFRVRIQIPAVPYDIVNY